jgi:hypothetical protein
MFDLAITFSVSMWFRSLAEELEPRTYTKRHEQDPNDKDTKYKKRISPGTQGTNAFGNGLSPGDPNCTINAEPVDLAINQTAFDGLKIAASNLPSPS